MIPLLLSALALAIAARLSLSAYRGLRAFVQFARVPRARVAELDQHGDSPRVRLSGRLRANGAPLSALDGTPCIALDREARDAKRVAAASLRQCRSVSAIIEDDSGAAALELQSFVLHVDPTISERPAAELPEALRPPDAEGPIRVHEYRLVDDVEVTLIAEVVGVDRVTDGYREQAERPRLGAQVSSTELWPYPARIIALRSLLFPLATLLFGVGIALGGYLFASTSLASSRIEAAAEGLERDHAIVESLENGTPGRAGE